MHSLFIAVKVVSDGPIYHLFFAAKWWKAGRLILVATPFGENTDDLLLPTASVVHLADGIVGGDRLARSWSISFLVMAGLAAAFGCARLLGAGRSASVVFPAGLSLDAPPVFFV